MKAIQGPFKNGMIYLKEPVSDCEQADVLVIFPDETSHKGSPPGDRGNAFRDLFGAWKDWWDNDMDELMRQAFAGRPDAAL